MHQTPLTLSLSPAGRGDISGIPLPDGEWEEVAVTHDRRGHISESCKASLCN
jgi:hypothetical protein